MRSSSSLLLLSLLPLSLSLKLCPSGWSTYAGASKCYKIVTPQVNSNELDYVQLCVNNGGMLASINNAFENRFLTAMANSNPVYFGLYVTSGRNFANIDGTNVTYNQIQFGNQDGCFAQINSQGNWQYLCQTSSQTGVICQTDFVQTCAAGFVPFGATNETVGNCYHVGYSATWQQAHDVCKTLGAELATIDSDAENAFVANLASAHTPLSKTQQVWLGGVYFAGNWDWYNFKPMTYTNWGPGNGNVTNIPSACLALSADEQNSTNTNISWQGKWFPSDCSQKQRAFICKSTPQTNI